MDLVCDRLGDLMAVRVPLPRIDAACAIQFKDRMREIGKDAPGRVVLDLEQVEFIDSSGLGAIVAVMKQLGSATTLELAALSPTVEKVFRLTRMDTVFAIHGTVAEAMESERRAG